jgi:putative zinc finger/helix-turn-helix YgiT family protein
MKRYCPSCHKTSEWLIIEHPEIYNVRGESIEVMTEFLQCPVCKAEYEDLNSKHDPYVIAYDEYRKRKGMVQPVEIRKFRDRFNLNQKELATLLGFGDVTLSRYENGALQDEAHDRLLQFVMDPSNLLHLLEHENHQIPSKKCETLIDDLKKELFQRACYDWFTPGESSIFTGYNHFDLKKVINTFKYLTYGTEEVKTKLLKLLFYIDFFQYKTYGNSLTGLSYKHFDYGPVPNEFDKLIIAVLDSDSTISKEFFPFGGYVGEAIRSSTPADLACFSKDELATLGYVKTFFKAYTAKRIVEFSHAEKAYQKTEDRQLISYDYAKELNI